MKPLLIAHRGASKIAPENTFAAFRKAVSAQVDFIECDIQFSQDEIPMIFHDNSLNRTTDAQIQKNINDQKYSELKNLSAGSWFASEFFTEKIPTLKDLLIEIREVGLMLEIKSTAISATRAVSIILNIIERYAAADQAIYLATSNLAIMKALINKVAKNKLMLILTSNNQLEHFLALEIINWAIDYTLINSNFLKKLPQQAQMWAWTVDNFKDVGPLINLGVNGIISNDVTILRQ